ncbi:M23 family metallopeptidase [Nocardioides caldifontis]|uniref:M23 family metallopeptidase n=1 Tax=Nocardioides caldifontis TaxID=2588938 RepID=UPI0011E02E15|nr:M23 family metallopeptidase [Nocardioides caldifontis]
MDRPSPRAPRRALLRRALVAAAAGGLLLGVLPAAADDLEDKKDKVEKKIDEADQHVHESSKAVEETTQKLLAAQQDLFAARDHLAKTRGELAAAVALDKQMQARLDAAVERLRIARKELAAGQRDVGAQEDRIRAMVVSTYESGDPALMGLSMVFNTQDPTQLAGQLNSNTDVVNMEAALLDQLEAAKVLLAVKEDETEDAKQEVAEKRQQAAENLEKKKALEAQAEEAETAVAELVSLRQQARRNAVEAKNADLAELAKLEAERDRIERLIAEKASKTSFTGYVDGNGYLSMPVDGSITSPYGYRTHPIWGYRSLHDGIDFGAACGTPIRAAAPGKVISRYYQSAWGNRIIIDHGVKHGVGLSTISNHLSSYAVGVGDRVDRGDVIGYVGTTGWSTGCHLHWTVNQNGTPVDPMNWL